MRRIALPGRFRLAGLLALIYVTTAAATPLYDPTRPPAGATAVPADAQAVAEPLQVSFIRSADKRRLARINGRWVAEGDQVAGAVVVRIESGHVRLRRQGRVFDVPLQGGGVQKRMAEPAG